MRAIGFDIGGTALKAGAIDADGGNRVETSRETGPDTDLERLIGLFAEIRDEEVWLRGMYIKPYSHGSYLNHEERRDRKLLLHRREIRELEKGVTRKGYTIVPLKAYFKEGKVKIQIGLARGKKAYDKREAIREKDDRREMDRRIKSAARG